MRPLALVLFTFLVPGVLLAQQQSDGRTRRQSAPRPFAVDSTHDRFTDESLVRLFSRPLPTSIAGLTFKAMAMCEPGGACSFRALHIEYLSTSTTQVSDAIYRELSSELTCFDLIFHISSDLRRDRACAMRAVAGRKGSTKYVRVVNVNALLLEDELRAAAKIEGRFEVGGRAAMEFTIEPSAVESLKGFWREFDRRRR